MAKRLAGKIALVTGGSRGIGAATARALAEDGADVRRGGRFVEGRRQVRPAVRGKRRRRGGHARRDREGVVFLASDDSSYVTGIELFVEGGMAQI